MVKSHKLSTRLLQITEKVAIEVRNEMDLTQSDTSLKK
jgi:hypothetical protein